MQEELFTFLASEYFQLWKDHGLEHLVEARFKLSPSETSNAAKPRHITAPSSAAPSLLPTFGPPVSGARRDSPVGGTLEDIRQWIGDCTRCGLCEARKHIVFGTGNPAARLMFIGEGPGEEEDQKGLPFIGAAGQLLTKIIEAMGYTRDQVYIANVVKCRPPASRAPDAHEISTCQPFLQSQVNLIRPKIIVALGAVSTATLTGRATSMAGLRGHFHPLVWNAEIPVMPTYHPAYLLRNPGAKKHVWKDMKAVKARLEAKA
jgi:DNA polymerase